MTSTHQISFEGVLEKTAAGIFRNKTKVWMVLRDTSLEYFKENKRSSCIGSIDLYEVQSIRQLLGQKAGCQFEIFAPNKTYVFSAETAELCAAWVSVLQQAMSLRESQSPSARGEPSSRPSVACGSIYATVNDASGRVSSSSSYRDSAQSAIYSEPEDIPISPTVKTVFGVSLKSRNSSVKSRTRSASSSSDNPPSPTAKVSSTPSKFEAVTQTGSFRSATGTSPQTYKASSASKRGDYRSSQSRSVTEDEEPDTNYSTINEVRPSFPEKPPSPVLAKSGKSYRATNHDQPQIYENAPSTESQQPTSDGGKVNSQLCTKDTDHTQSVVQDSTTPQPANTNEARKDNSVVTRRKSPAKEADATPELIRVESTHLYDSPTNLDDNTVVLRRRSNRTSSTNGSSSVAPSGRLRSERNTKVRQPEPVLDDIQPDDEELEAVYENVFKDDIENGYTDPGVLQDELFVNNPAYSKLKTFLETELNASCNGVLAYNGDAVSELRKFLHG